MKIWVQSPYKNIFRDEVPGIWDDTEFSLVMAKNERESFQILLRSDHNFNINSVTFSDLSSSEGNKISSDNLSYGFVEYEYLGKNSKETEESALIRKAPGFFPDPISNNRGISVNQKETQAIWVSLYAPKDATPALYKAFATVHTNMGDFKAKFTAEICNVTIPDPENSEFTFLLWQQYINEHSNESTRIPPIFREYGYKRFTKEWWELVDDIGRRMYESRINDLFVDTQILLLDGGTYIDEEGHYHFNFSKFDEFIDFFRSKYPFKILVGSHLTTCNYRNLTHPLLLIKPDKNNELQVLAEEKWDNELSVHWLNEFLPALQSHLEEKGLLDIWYQHIGDECFTEEQIRNHKFLCKKMAELAPKIKYGDAVMSVKVSEEQLASGAKFLVPLVEPWENNLEYYKAKKNEGIEVYPYTCCGPIGDWLKCFIDLPQWSIRSLIWRIYSAGFNGYLLWSFFFWSHIGLSENQNAPVDECEFKGDDRLLHPDITGNRVRSSIRLNAIRDGAEDFELLKILEKKNPELSRELSEKIVRKCVKDYSRDIKLMKEVRDKLVRLAAGKDSESEIKGSIDTRFIAGKID